MFNAELTVALPPTCAKWISVSGPCQDTYHVPLAGQVNRAWLEMTSVSSCIMVGLRDHNEG